MSEEDDKKLYKTLGVLEAGIKNLDGKVDDVRGELREVREDLKELNGKTVKQPQCSENVRGIHEAIGGLRGDIAKKKTKDTWPSVPAAATQFNTAEVSQASEPKVSLATKIKENAAAISAVLGLLGILVVGGYKVTNFVSRLELAAAQQSKTLKEIKTKAARIIYVTPKDHKSKDAGAE